MIERILRPLISPVPIVIGLVGSRGTCIFTSCTFLSRSVVRNADVTRMSQQRHRINRLSSQRFGIEIWYLFSIFLSFVALNESEERTAFGSVLIYVVVSLFSDIYCIDLVLKYAEPISSAVSRTYGVHTLFVHFLICFTVWLKQFPIGDTPRTFSVP